MDIEMFKGFLLLNLSNWESPTNIHNLFAQNQFLGNNFSDHLSRINKGLLLQYCTEQFGQPQPDLMECLVPYIQPKDMELSIYYKLKYRIFFSSHST